MVRKSDNSGYRLYITLKWKVTRQGENQAAAYMNHCGLEIMRAPERISGFIAVSRLARWEKRHSTSEKGRKAFYLIIPHCHNIHRKLLIPAFSDKSPILQAFLLCRRRVAQ